MSFAWPLVAIGIVVVILGDMTKGKVNTAASIAIITAFGSASLAIQHLVRRTLPCTSATELATKYRERFFLRLAMSESIALVAFVLGMVMGPWWLFYVGVPFTLLGFWRLAPTRQHIQEDQDRLSASGCMLSLMTALRTPTT